MELYLQIDWKASRFRLFTIAWDEVKNTVTGKKGHLFEFAIIGIALILIINKSK